MSEFRTGGNRHIDFERSYDGSIEYALDESDPKWGPNGFSAEIHKRAWQQAVEQQKTTLTWDDWSRQSRQESQTGESPSTTTSHPQLIPEIQAVKRFVFCPRALAMLALPYRDTGSLTWRRTAGKHLGTF